MHENCLDVTWMLNLLTLDVKIFNSSKFVFHILCETSLSNNGDILNINKEERNIAV